MKKCWSFFSFFFSSLHDQKEAEKVKTESKESDDEEMEVENGEKEAASEVKA